jgi:hypothetical protein
LKRESSGTAVLRGEEIELRFNADVDIEPERWLIACQPHAGVSPIALRGSGQT